MPHHQHLDFRTSSHLLFASQVEDPGLRDLLHGLLRFDPEQRSSAEAALAHPWLSQFVAADALAGGGPGAPAVATEGAPAPAGAPLGAYPSTPRQAPAGGASSGEAGGRVALSERSSVGEGPGVPEEFRKSLEGEPGRQSLEWRKRLVRMLKGRDAEADAAETSGGHVQ